MLLLLLGVILVVIILLVGGLFLLTQVQDWRHSRYFKERNVPYIGAGTGRLFKVLTGQMSLIDAEQILYQDAVNTGAPFVGLSDNFVGPGFFIMDLDLMKNIYVKDFDHFANRRTVSTQVTETLLRKMLISLEGEQWKDMRSKLSPTFTTGKIRRMFRIFDKSSQRMCQYLEEVIIGTSDDKDYDLCEIFSKYAMDVIASCAFGIDSKAFEITSGVKSEFETHAQELQFRFKPLFFFKLLLLLMAPKAADALGVQIFDAASQNYFRMIIKDVMRHRREKNERQDDFLQLMMDTQDGLLKAEENSKESMEVMSGAGSAENDDNQGLHDSLLTHSGESDKLQFDDESIVANCVLFLIGGFDTLQSLLIFATYQLAMEPEMQEKLRKEVQDAMDENDGKLTYEALNGMNYLDMFINETLRYLSPAPRSERMCTKDYKIPGSEVVIKKGQIVGLPVFAMQRDPRYYENPLKFDPERFTPEAKAKRHAYSFAPFGHGPRNCIGMRFALIEVKAVIATLVSLIKLQPCSKTDIPPVFGSSSSLKPKNGLWLNISSPSHT